MRKAASTSRVRGLRRSLALSVLALLLSVAMLAGSTFAWFSDEASTSSVRVTAGNLDIDLLKYSEDTGNYETVSDSDPIFPEGFLWEPGRVLVIPLAVKNNGTLSVKFNVNLTVQNYGLADAMEYIVLDGKKNEDVHGADWEALTNNISEVFEKVENLSARLDAATEQNSGISLKGVQAVTVLGGDGINDTPVFLDPQGDGEDTHFFVLAIRMKSFIDGEDLFKYQLKSIKFDLLVNATQYNSEPDSFGPGYDSGLPLTVPHLYYLSQVDSWSALKNKPVDDYLKWRDLVKYIGEKQTESASVIDDMFISRITKVVFGYWDQQKRNLAGDAWNDGVPVAVTGVDESETETGTNRIRGFYKDNELYILVRDPLDFIGVTGTMGTSAGSYFSGWTALNEVDFSAFNTSGVKGSQGNNNASMRSLFEECTSLQTVTFGSGFVTSGVADMSKMFYGCNELTELDLRAFDTSNVTRMSGMFYGCAKLASLDLSSFDTRAVERIVFGNSSNGYRGLFEGCAKLKMIKSTPAIFTFENVTDMQNMFAGCAALNDLDVSGFKTDKVKNMRRMFYQCKSLGELDLSNFNTSNVTKANGMFRECESLSSINLSSFDVSQMSTMGNMFYRCKSLTELDLTSFDTNRAADIEGMFAYCSNLKTIWAKPIDINDSVGFRVNAEKNNVFVGCLSLNMDDQDAKEKSSDEPVGFMRFNYNYITSKYAICGSSAVGTVLPTVDGYFKSKSQQ